MRMRSSYTYDYFTWHICILHITTFEWTHAYTPSILSKYPFIYDKRPCILPYILAGSTWGDVNHIRMNKEWTHAYLTSPHVELASIEGSMQGLLSYIKGYLKSIFGVFCFLKILDPTSHESMCPHTTTTCKWVHTHFFCFFWKQTFFFWKYLVQHPTSQCVHSQRQPANEYTRRHTQTHADTHTYTHTDTDTHTYTYNIWISHVTDKCRTSQCAHSQRQPANEDAHRHTHTDTHAYIHTHTHTQYMN